MSLRIGQIGIGLMGSGIIKNLAKAGIPISFLAYKNRERVASLEKAGAREVACFQEFSREADAIFLVLPDSAAVESVLLSEDSLWPHLRGGQIVVDLSTSHPSSTRRLAERLRARGIELMDAPMTGSRPQAEEGKLNLMCGGDPEVFERLKPIFESIAAHVWHVGPVGSGHAIKLINNYLGLASLAAICEIFPLAEKAGVNFDKLFEVISSSGGNSNTFQGLVPRLLKREFGLNFRLGHAAKDIRYLTHLASELSAPLPLACSLLSILEMAAAKKNYREEDVSNLLRFWEEVSGDAPAPGD